MARVLKGGRAEPGTDENVGPGRLLQVNERPFDPKVEAARILADAQSEADRLRTQAVAEGRERGLAAVTELLVSARVRAARSQKDLESSLRTLAVRIAEKIIDRQLSLQPEVIVDIVAAALRQAGSPTEIVVRIHPDDLQALERGRPRLIERAGRSQILTLRADGSIGRGGCALETELGTVDARLPVQLAAIERALRDTQR